jgi:hypothetical protein
MIGPENPSSSRLRMITLPTRSGVLGGAENGDGPGLEQAFECAHAHAVSLSLGTNNLCPLLSLSIPAG